MQKIKYGQCRSKKKKKQLIETVPEKVQILNLLDRHLSAIVNMYKKLKETMYK